MFFFSRLRDWKKLFSLPLRRSEELGSISLSGVKFYYTFQRRTVIRLPNYLSLLEKLVFFNKLCIVLFTGSAIEGPLSVNLEC